MRRAVATAVMVASSVALAASCGARSELEVPDRCFHRSVGSAEILQLDAFVMLDTSGSMDFQVPGGGTRWSAMRQSLAGFLSSPASHQMGIALSFFPIIDHDVAQECQDDADCGMQGACRDNRVCLPSGGGQCLDDADCEAAGFIGDVCDETGRICDNRYTCAVGPYTTPVVPVGVLPDAAPALLGALEQQDRLGGTPTLPALSGIVEQARARLASHPNHKSIVIFASDGLPTACDPALDSSDPRTAIDNLVEVARDAADDSIQVFVIGVAAPPTGTTRPDLDAIAAAGDTGAAFNITADEDLAEQLLIAFNEIRITAEACTFPVDIEVTDVDLRQAEVVFQAGTETHTAGWRPSESACHPTRGGFYYDVALDSGAIPEHVTLCPASCAAFGTTIRRAIELRTPCVDPAIPEHVE